MKAFIVSDVHLDDMGSERCRQWLDFFSAKSKDFDRVYILGDLFDVWPGTNSFLLERFSEVLNEIKKRVQAGCLVTYVEGNHDYHLGRFFSEGLGVRVVENSVVERWGTFQVHLSHGDLGNPHDKSYRVLRSVLRSEPMRQLSRTLPGSFVYAAGDLASRASRGSQSLTPEIEENVRQIYRRTAEQLFQEGNDAVIMGHTHIPDRHEILLNGRKKIYLNSGDWVRNFTYIEFDTDEFYNRSLRGPN